MTAEPDPRPAPETPSLRRNAALNLFRVAAGLLLPLLTFPYLTRVLGPDGVGRIGFATGFASYFLLLSSIGIPLYGMREVAKVRHDPKALSGLVRELLVLNSIATAVACAVYLGILLLDGRLRGDLALFLIAGGAIPAGTLALEWLYQGQERYAYITARSVGFNLLSAAALFPLVRGAGDYRTAAGIGVVATLGASLLNSWNARSVLREAPAGPLRLKRHIAPLATVFALNSVISIYVNLDTVMLGFLSDSRSVGYYSSAMKLTKALLALVTSVGGVLLPRLSRCLAEGDAAGFDHILRQSLGAVVLLCLPLSAGLALLSREIIALVAGPAYLPAAACMVVTAPVIAFIGLTNIVGIQVLYPLGREKEVVASVGFGAAVSFVLNLVLIPRWAHMGAAWATFWAESSVLVLQLFLVRGRHRIPWPTRTLLACSAATVLMCAVVQATRLATAGLPDWERLPLEIGAGTASYGFLLLLFREEFLLNQIARLRDGIGHN